MGCNGEGLHKENTWADILEIFLNACRSTTSPICRIAIFYLSMNALPVPKYLRQLSGSPVKYKPNYEIPADLTDNSKFSLIFSLKRIASVPPPSLPLTLTLSSTIKYPVWEIRFQSLARFDYLVKSFAVNANVTKCQTSRQIDKTSQIFARCSLSKLTGREPRPKSDGIVTSINSETRGYLTISLTFEHHLHVRYHRNLFQLRRFAIARLKCWLFLFPLRLS